MRLLSVGGHVIMLRQHLNLEQGPSISFEAVGVNQATVFTGLCDRHDSSIFAPVERDAARVESRECLFLLAYRAILRETHVSLEAAAKLQSVYLKQCDLGLVDRNTPTRGGLFAVGRLINAYETWLYKVEVDQAFLRGDFAAFKHDVLDLGNTGPCIAVSSLFSLDDVRVRDDVARVALTVFPTRAGRSYAILSYAGRDARPARAKLRPIIGAPTERRRYLVSRLVLDSSDNIVISPRVFARLGAERQEKILRFFTATILKSDDTFHDEALNLFDLGAAKRLQPTALRAMVKRRG